MPDIYVENSGESDYVTALKQEACFFDFAIEYLRTRKIPLDFRVDDRIISEFKNFVADRGFAFMDEDRVAFNEFKEKISFLDDETGEALRILENRLNSNEIWQFDNHYSEIMTVLNEEIILQSRGEKALYENMAQRSCRDSGSQGGPHGFPKISFDFSFALILAFFDL